MARPFGLLTIDLEDYRRQELRDHRRWEEPAHPDEVRRQLDSLLATLATTGARATFFTVGRLAAELPPRAWDAITACHRIACHSHEHRRVQHLGRDGFESDLRAAKDALEAASGQPVLSYRAPYFSGERCDPWFGEVLARAGFRLDSSRRLRSAPAGFRGTMPLEGGGAVREVPLPSIGCGAKRITIIGGSYLRLLPLGWIVRLLEWGRARGFLPMVYLHPYDLDPVAAPLEYERFRQWLPRVGDWVRRRGRRTAEEKLRALARLYEFRPIESLLEPDRVATACPPPDRIAAPAIGPFADFGPLDCPDSAGIEMGDPHGMPLHLT